MTRTGLFFFLFLCVLCACQGPSAFLLRASATAAKVAYRGDLANATAVARRHCARYERVERLVSADFDTAYFKCVRP